MYKYIKNQIKIKNPNQNICMLDLDNFYFYGLG